MLHGVLMLSGLIISKLIVSLIFGLLTSKMLIFFLGYLVGTLVTLISVIGYVSYQYYKTWDEAYKEGWDMPN
jgi:hypothetical protein